MSSVAIKWMEEGSRLFACRDSSGNTIMSGSWSGDTNDDRTWIATRPTDLLLMGLASCAAHDVVAILERQRQRLTSLRVDVEGQQAADPPFAFTGIHLRFILSGQDLDVARVERALMLSVEKYCPVVATVRGVASITHDYEIER